MDRISRKEFNALADYAVENGLADKLLEQAHLALHALIVPRFGATKREYTFDQDGKRILQKEVHTYVPPDSKMVQWVLERLDSHRFSKDGSVSSVNILGGIEPGKKVFESDEKVMREALLGSSVEDVVPNESVPESESVSNTPDPFMDID